MRKDSRKLIKRQEWIYLLIVASLIAVGLYAPSFTGMASADIAPGQVIRGNYSVMPHFSINTTHSLDKYRQLRIDARSLITEAQACLLLDEQCIMQSMQTLGLDWQLSCGSGQERFFLDFAEFYSGCKASKDNDCLCALEYGTKEYDDGIYLVSLRYVDGSTVIEANGQQGTSVPGTPSILQPMDGLADFISPDRMDLSYIYSGSKLTKSAIQINGNEQPIQDKLRLYKTNPDLAILPDSYQLDKPACTMPEKRTYAFCVDDGKVTTATDSDTAVALRPYRYRFALYFPSAEP
jgi:hypothetical protein